jgi:hypothetical protein
LVIGLPLTAGAVVFFAHGDGEKNPATTRDFALPLRLALLSKNDYKTSLG